MTYVQYINCEKWKKVIGFTLWSSLTLGLTYLLFYNINYLIKYGFAQCGNLGSSGQWYCFTNSFDPIIVLFTALCILVNGINDILVLDFINSRYKWIEIRCGVKPKSEVVN